MNLKNTLLFTSLVLVLISCTNDSTNDLTEPLDINQTVKFSSVQSIMQNNCNNCHGNPTSGGAPISLVTYNEVKAAVLESDLIGRMSIENGGDGLMPEGGPRLPQTTIDVVIKWQADGFQE
ncbi:putative membrane protein [Flavobacterium arsenatis]|uniref:Membrane protein n=1 Tax=Flavobacterium arsenatis TaxID=1484332 RepID=A0ABU1TMI8_9FLAO|nr:c-type cytochrome [Flavobacterium arsenatis]MDR6967032.1 putative membrane protein [Flavobacterium arsenatis]